MSIIIKHPPIYKRDKEIHMSADSAEVLKFFIENDSIWMNKLVIVNSLNMPMSQVQASIVKLESIGFIEKMDNYSFYKFVKQQEKIIFKEEC